MAQTYQDILGWFYGLQRFGIKLGLEKISMLLNGLGNPEQSYPSIHIAGTNGKGSIASMIAAILQSSGLKVGLYTSPHLVRFSERIKVNGTEITEEEIVGYSSHLQRRVDSLRATFFEATTALAFKFFSDHGVDIAVVETGMGGSFDATNVVTPIVTVITGIGLEHQKYLGKTLSQIAREKGGIIKQRVPVVSGVQSARAIAVLREIAGKNHAPFMEVTPNTTALLDKSTFEGSVVDLYYRESIHYEGVRISLPGIHQIQNALVAVYTIDLLRGKIIPDYSHFTVSDEHLRAGLENVTALTGLRGRMELLDRNGRWLLDVAHNPGAVRELVRSFQDLTDRRIPVIFGVLNDKDVSSMMHTLSRIARCIYLVSPRNERAVATDTLKQIGSKFIFPLIESGSVREGITHSRGDLEHREMVLITGSHFVVGEALEVLEGDF
jgi:dihydrofolate synthase / folylpolyglutamate synthase